MSDPAVRMPGPADAAVLDRVADELFDGPVDPALVRELLAGPRHHLAGAVDGGVLVGFASGVHYAHPEKRAQLFVNEVSVARPHRRRGIGAALVGAPLERARGLGCTEAWVLPEDDNDAALALGRRAGAGRAARCVSLTFPLDVAGPA